ncbi:hypothetical protein [Gorillibacterium timonense]|uniref:hypothetical protein n=1 Tax=Gorillibacterium timonense TaxID=1689269 RepID=UPI001F1C4FFE|nr:hypothetical protein [Gorillibacterium timonense]
MKTLGQRRNGSRKRRGFLSNEKGMSNLLVTLMIMPVLLFLCLIIVPFFVYTMKLDHLNTIANHALKEAEAVGYFSPAIAVSTTDRLDHLGMGEVTVKGNSYPDYSGSTPVKVLRDSPDPTVTVVIRYPAPTLARMLAAIGGSASSNQSEGYFQVTLYGRSEAYE